MTFVRQPARRRSVLGWLAERHSLAVELFAVVALYGFYETSRGLVAGDSSLAVQHARGIASLERSLHVFDEVHVQNAARAVPGLVGTLGVLYLTLHLTVTGLYLLWLHRRRPAAFPHVRTALLTGSLLALIGFVAFPTAPPRLARLGIADTISHGSLDLNHGLVSAFYNPYAAVPSMHICYATIVGVSLFRHGGHPVLRVVALIYPALQLFVIVATGNHFFFDAATGLAVAAASLAVAAALSWARREPCEAATRLRAAHDFGWPAYSESLTAVRAAPRPRAASKEWKRRRGVPPPRDRNRTR